MQLSLNFHRVLSLIVSFSLLISLLPTAAFAAGETIVTTKSAKDTYYVGEEISFLFTRGDLVGTVRGQLSSENGGVFSQGTTQGTCSEPFSETYTATIASNANRKAFCFKAAAAGTETISLVVEQTGQTLSYELTIVDLPTLSYNETGEVRICTFVGGDTEPYLSQNFSVGVDGQLSDNQTGTSEAALQNIIPPYQYLTNTYEIVTYEGRNWTLENRAIYNNSCARIDTPIEGCTNELAINFNPFATIEDGTCEYDIVCDPGFTLNDSQECVSEVAQRCEQGPNLIKNGSFEDPTSAANAFDEGYFEVFTNIPYWSATNSIELWRNMFGGAKDGFQNVELDVATSTTISQSVSTEIGARYELRFNVSPRPGTSLSENKIKILLNDETLQEWESDASGNRNNSWEQYSHVFLASTHNTVVSFSDVGTPNGVGGLLDDVSLCLVAEPVYGCTDESALNFSSEATVSDDSCLYENNLYHIEGYVYHDQNGNLRYDREVVDSGTAGEEPLPGWTVSISNGEQTITTVTDKDGRYSFSVPRGTWTITNTVNSGWKLVTQTPFIVTVPNRDRDTVSFFKSLEDMFLPAIHVEDQSRDTYGSFDFGHVKERGNNTGTRVNQNTLPGRVLGISTNQCGMVLKDYMRMGMENDSAQVRLLQAFLQGQGYLGVTNSGIFDEATDTAVRQFQTMHKDEILAPWLSNDTNPTGYVYKLTRWKINNIICPGSEPYPTLIP